MLTKFAHQVYGAGSRAEAASGQPLVGGKLCALLSKLGARLKQHLGLFHNQ